MQKKVFYVMPLSPTRNPTGLTSLRLRQLCQPEQLQRTLQLLFYMNHWAKDREHLFFADRQGLYRVKAAVVQRAYAVRAMEAIAYIDGTQSFGQDLTPNIAANITAKDLIERLNGLKIGTTAMSMRS